MASASSITHKQEEEENYSYANNIGMSVILPMALRTAIELDLFEIIAKAGPHAKLSASDIATRIPTKSPKGPVLLDRILRLLTSYQLLDCSLSDQTRLYSINSVSKYYVKNKDHVSFAPFFQFFLQEPYLQSWSKLKDAIVEGGDSFKMVHGMSMFEYSAKHPDYNEAYNKGVYNHTMITMNMILDTYKGFENFHQIVDVGGNFGMLASIITSRYPHIKVINFDMPHVIKEAPTYPGVEHVSGDMFQSVPKGDAITIKSVLNCFDVEVVIRVLKNCYNAIPNNGKVIVMQYVLSTVPETNEAARDHEIMQVHLAMRTDGGQERTKEDWMRLACGSGFKGINFACCVCNYHVMELYK